MQKGFTSAALWGIIVESADEGRHAEHWKLKRNTSKNSFLSGEQNTENK